MKTLSAFLLFGATAMAQSTLHIDSIASQSLGATRSFGVLLPKTYDNSTRYPVLYLLHGHDGSHADWVNRTDLKRIVADIPLIVVLPDADNSWYVNSYTEPHRRYEDYLVRELRTEVERRYRIDTTKRCIAGLSMGGYGSLLYALKYPGLFQFAGSLSGAFIFPRFIEDTIRQPVGKGLASSLRKAFGNGPNSHRDSNDVFLLFTSASKDTVPYVYLVHGIQDGFRGFLAAHRMLADSLRSIGARYEYHEVRGTHSWATWGREIRALLVRMRQVLNF